LWAILQKKKEEEEEEEEMAEKEAGYGAREKFRITLEGNADAVEFCPAASSSSLLAAGTYTLLESHGSRPSIGTEPDENGADPPSSSSSSSSRYGSLSLFAMTEEKLRLTQRIPTAGIFDIRWRPYDEKADSHPLLAQASSDGTISLYRLQVKEKNEKLSV
jgi:WD40 repeat protein